MMIVSPVKHITVCSLDVPMTDTLQSYNAAALNKFYALHIAT